MKAEGHVPWDFFCGVFSISGLSGLCCLQLQLVWLSAFCWLVLVAGVVLGGFFVLRGAWWYEA